MNRAACLLLLYGLLVMAQVQPALSQSAQSEPAQLTFDQAVQALSTGDYSAAERGFQSVLKQHPNNVGAIGNLGILFARTNRMDKAIAEYQRALRLSPNDKPILLNLGLVYLKEELHSRALPFFERVLVIDPHDPQARQLRDVCRLYAGQVTSALGDLKLLSEANPQDEQLLFLLGFAYLKAGDSKTGQATFHQMFEAAGPARAQFLLGKASYEAAEFPQAEQSFLEVIKLDAHFPGSHLELGKVYVSERRTTDATQQFREALKENPKDEEANYFLGSLLVRENQDEQGVPYLEEAKRLKADSYGVYLYLGRAKLHLGQTAEAIKLLQQAVELNPDDASAQYTLGRALKRGGQQTEATKAFAQARSLNAHAEAEATIPGIR